MTKPLVSSSKTLTAAGHAFLFCAGFTILVMLFSATSSIIPAPAQRFYYGLLGVLAGFIITWLFLRFVGKHSWSSIGFHPDGRTVTRLIAGFLTGLVVMGLTSLGVIYFSGLKIVTNTESSLVSFLFSTAALVPLAYMEEIAFRGYPFQYLKEGAGPRTAIVITALLFAVYHLFNGYSLQDALLGTGTFGILFGSAAYYANGIAFPTSMHYAVNLVTSAFATAAGSSSLWLLQTKDGSPIEQHQTGRAIVLVPQLLLLLVAVMAMEWVIRNKQNS